MTKIKKIAVILAVVFVAAFCAGWAICEVVADMTRATVEANQK